MALQQFELGDASGSVPIQELTLIYGGEAPLPGSSQLFDEYMRLRVACSELPKPDEAATAAVIEDVRGWIEGESILPQPESVKDYYSTYDQDVVESKMGKLLDYLASDHADTVSREELDATRAFIDSAFAMHEDCSGTGAVHPDADGTFAFVVPARMDKEHTEYGQEAEPIIPAMRYVPNELRAQMMIGLPPFVIETYEPTKEGKRGYVVLAPVYGDIASDLVNEFMADSPELDFDDPGNMMEAITYASKIGKSTARDRVNDAVDFAQERLGVDIVGLGTVLPGLTRYGTTITNQNVITTTGHGGTLQMVRGIVKREEAKRGAPYKNVGLLGLGSIGKSGAYLNTQDYPNATHHVFDSRPATNEEVGGRLASGSRAEVIVAQSEREVIDSSDVVISFIAGTLDLDAIGVKDLRGKLLVDDSQPRSIDPWRIRELGGTPADVIAYDTQGIAVREGYDYGETLADAKRSLFGCEAEAATLAAYLQDLRERGMPEEAAKRVVARVAIRSAVTPKSASLIGTLFRKFGIQPDALQADGKYLEPVS